MISKIKEGLKGRYSSDYNQFKWKGEFLSESTCAFHRKLMLVTEPFSIQVLTKTALTDLFYVKGNKVDELNHQYLDFLLCDEKSMTPLLAINIDNKKKQGIVDDLNNFGIIRDVNTLKWLDVAPIFDNGEALKIEYYDEEEGWQA